MKFRLTATVAASALMLGLAAPAFAEGAAPAAAAVQAPQGVTVPPLGFAKRVLPNGLEVYTARDADTSNVTVQVWYKVGSKDDPAGRSGFAHLFEHLMFKSTKNLPPETFDRLTEDVGGSNNAFTADDTTAYFETVPANHLERMLFAEADRMGSLVVDEPTFVAERDVVKEEYRQRILANPYGRLFGLFVPETIYQESPYRRPGIGSIEELEASSLEDVRRFHATYYRPDAAYLIVAGNFDQAQLDRWIDQYFGPLKNPTTPIPVNNVVEPEPTGPRNVTYYAPNVPLPAAVVAWPTVKYADADRAALTVLDGILSTGESSRLYRSLVYDKQIAAQIGSTPDFSQQAGNLSALAIMAQGHTAEEGVAALNEEIAKLRDAPVTAEELSEAKNEIVADALRSRETVDDRATALGFALINTGSAAAADDEVAQIQAVTVADVQRVARKYLTPQRQSTITFLAADDQNPASVQKMNVGAPVTVADLALAGPPAVLLPEAERTPLPQPGAEVAPATPAVADFRLDNGLRVLVAPTDGVPLVSARLSFDAGSSDDPSGKAGIAAMTAALLTQGTKTKTAPEIATQIEQLGASIGAGAGVDFSNVYANVPSNAFPETVALMADLVKNPTFAAEELERQQAQTLDGLRVALSQPAAIAGMTVGRVIYGDAPYGATITQQTVPTIIPADVAAFHAARYRPSDATLVFSGDITPDAARALAQQAFGDWNPAGAAPAATANPAGEALAPRIVVVNQPGAGQAAVVAAVRGVSRTDADFFPLTVGNTLLGGGFSSRLNQEIRIKRGLSYGASSSLGVRADAGLFTASTQTKNETADEVADLILAEIAKLGAETPTQADLAPRRATLIGGFGRSLETVDGLGALVANLALYDLPMSDLADYAGRVRAVTPEQVQAAFAEHLPVDRASLVIVGDGSLFLDALRAKHPNLEVIEAGALNLNNGALK
ncbi:M16 family metallopeptidase [Brevundimonas sp. TWP1-2-1b1]|uniref:M16 family metallopeptidase n=1 Tax=unclassified Brevundimonas TaxID=2622653 RepID=UPI003CF8BF8B